MTARDLKRTDIVAYAKGAIECLTQQLPHKKTEKSKAKIQSRIDDWKKVLTNQHKGG